jgi:2-keto-4-pentenoate hydratase/2-oxohepta-3-ene-1,7-dioic acid hydratase in catechol pathway
MKLVCVGRNYAEHARELGNELPEEPVLFMKPETALLPLGSPFVLPTFSAEIHYELELVLRISRQTRQVTELEARDCYDAIALGLDFTARDLQARCKAKGLPWEIAKAFDGSAAIGDFFAAPEGEIRFSLRKNGHLAQSGATADMIYGFDALLSYASRFFTLLPGDLVFTGTPAGVGPVAKGDVLEGFLGEDLRLKCEIR